MSEVGKNLCDKNDYPIYNMENTKTPGVYCWIRASSSSIPHSHTQFSYSLCSSMERELNDYAWKFDF